MISSFLLAAVVFAVPPASSTSAKDLEQMAREHLQLSSVELVKVDWQTQMNGALMSVKVQGVPLSFALRPHSIREPGFEVLVQESDGSWTSHPPAEPRTWRGELVTDPGVEVAASNLEDGIFARIRDQAGQDWWIQPIYPDISPVPTDIHALYRTGDNLPTHGLCGVTEDRKWRPDGPASDGSSGMAHTESLEIAQIGCDADYEYFLSRGSNVDKVTGRIERVLNTMDLQYEDEVGISHHPTKILVRTSSNQPYTSNDPGTLLGQFQNEWNANQGGINRDIAHLFTGKNLAGGVIGIAYLGVICSSGSGYGLVQSDFNGNFSCATDLSAHELGHNWNAAHCDCPVNTMNPYITCANAFHPSLTIPGMISYRNSRTCLNTITTTHVQSITPKLKGGPNLKRGKVKIKVKDNVVFTVPNATVTVQFTGDFNETVVGVTNKKGIVTLLTTAQYSGIPSYTVCVTNIQHPQLTYDPSLNVETCDNY